MSDHSHYEIARHSAKALPVLLLVFALEVPAGFFSGMMSINAHSFDVFSDIAAFSIVIIGAWFSGRRDDQGRDHEEIHGEQIGIACFNLALLGFGAAFVLQRSLGSFGERQENSWQDLWVLVGPLLATFAYLWIRSHLRKNANDLTVGSLEAHVKADAAVAAMVFGLTLLAFLVQTSWINPVGGLATSAILLLLSWQLGKHIVESVRGKNQHDLI